MQTLVQKMQEQSADDRVEPSRMNRETQATFPVVPDRVLVAATFALLA